MNQYKKNYLSWKRFFSEVIVLHGLFRGDPFCWVHGQQFGQELEGFALGLDAVAVHVLHQGTVQVTKIDLKKLVLKMYYNFI